MEQRKAIERAILDLVPSLPANQKKVADFFLEHLSLVALLPIKDVALRAAVSEASIVRFAQMLGFKGYKELKDALSTTLKNQLSPTEYYQLAITEKEKTPDIFKLVAHNVITNINDTIKSIEYNVFSNAVDSIIAAHRIYCLGMELSHHLSRLMTFLLRTYSYDAHYLSVDFLQYREQIAYMTPQDLLIAFSFSPYSRETVEAISFAKERGIPSVAFTDKKTAPIREFATYCLQIKTDNIMFSNSLGAIVTVINAMIIELNFRDKERTLKALKIIEENIKDERYFIR
ncbi:MAG: MurR/RpiR family transcriptional regulator [candidate division KSB1 bacterium]|nr:MurR/RpiR family transcriptional regulator [candidate division KSB1 bacterium]